MSQPYLSSKQAIFAGFAVMILVLLGVILVSLSRFSALQRRFEDIAKSQVIRSQAVAKMVVVAREHSLSIQTMAFLRDPFARDEALHQYEKEARIFFAQRAVFESSRPTKDEVAAFEQIKKIIREDTVFHQQVLDLLSDPDAGDAEFSQASQIIQDHIIPIDNRLKRKLYGLLDLQQKLLQHEFDQVNQATRRASSVFVALAVFALLIAVSTAYYVIRKSMAAELQVYEEKHRAERTIENLAWKAEHDALTKLANRRLFTRSMEALLEKAKTTRSEHAVVFIDLDDFKPINDNYGHDAGDRMLVELSELLARKVRKDDLIARLGGDEFGVLLYGCNAEAAERITRQIQRAIDEYVFVWEGRELRVGMSAGFALVGPDTRDVEAALREADMACYNNKRMRKTPN